MSEQENNRAQRIAYMTDGFHQDVTQIYEQIVDREYVSAKDKIISLMRDLRETLKLIEDDDF